MQRRNQSRMLQKIDALSNLEETELGVHTILAQIDHNCFLLCIFQPASSACFLVLKKCQTSPRQGLLLREVVVAERAAAGR